MAVKQGYRKVFVYNEGLPAWIKRGFPVEKRLDLPRPDVPFVSPIALMKMIENREDVFIIDLRDSDDRKAGYIKQSAGILMSDLDKLYKKIPKNKKIILLDLYGKQTYIAARFLALKGYNDICRLDGGFVGGWIKTGLPIEK